MPNDPADTPTLLVVEDDPEQAAMLVEYFRANGYRVHPATQGSEALDYCQTHVPDVALLDIHLPDMDGYTLARRLHHQRRTQHVPLIFLTQRHARRDRLHGLQLGAIDYLTKPYDLRELHLRVRNLISRAHTLSLYNAITTLPDGPLVDDYLSRLLTQPDWAIITLALAGADSFRERYGFVASNDLLKGLSLFAQDALGRVDAQVDFVGHLTHDILLIGTHRAHAQAVLSHVQGQLARPFDFFYPHDTDWRALADKVAVQARLHMPGKQTFGTIAALKEWLARA